MVRARRPSDLTVAPPPRRAAGFSVSARQRRHSTGSALIHSDAVSDIEFLIAVLFAAAVLVRLADLVAIPYPIVLVIGGVAIGFVPGLPDIELAPDAVFLLFLPPLLHASGFAASPQELRAASAPARVADVRARARDDERRRGRRSRGDRAALAGGVHPRSDPRADRSRLGGGDVQPSRRARARQHRRRGRGDAQRRRRARRLPDRDRRGRSGGVLDRHRRLGVRALGRRGRCGRACGRLDRPAPAAQAQRRAAVDLPVGALRLRGIHRCRERRRFGRARDGHHGRLVRLALARDVRRRHAPERDRLLAGARLRPQRDALRPARPAVRGRARQRARRRGDIAALLGRRRDRQRRRHRRAARVGRRRAAAGARRAGRAAAPTRARTGASGWSSAGRACAARSRWRPRSR